MKIAISGATGFIGSRLVRRILDGGGEEVLVFARDPARARSRLPAEIEVAAWDPISGPPPPETLEGAGAVINLAGEPVGQRWTPAVKDRIRESRILSTRNIVAGLLACRDRPRALISGSAVGYYGVQGGEILDEGSPPGNDFLADLCRDWESEAARASEGGTRVVQARIGLVLGPHGGVLARIVPAFKVFLGGPLGDGLQWMSWIHIDDATGALLHALRTEGLSGPLNMTSPSPVQNIEFARKLGKVLGRPSAFPTPAALLRALVGEFADILITGQRVIPNKLEGSGFRFRFQDLEAALRNILAR